MRVRCLILGVATAFGACADDTSRGTQDRDTTLDARDAGDTAPRDSVFVDSAPEDTAPETIVDTFEVYTPPPCPWERYDHGLAGGRVDGVFFDPRGTAPYYATAGSALLRSFDDGVTWERTVENEHGFGRLLFPADRSKVILAAGSAGLQESLDGGSTWAIKALGGFALHRAYLHPAAPRRLFVGTLWAGIFRSEDGGDTFGAANVGVPLGRVQSFDAPPDDPSIVLAGILRGNDAGGASDHGAILRSTDGGSVWEVVLDGVGWANELARCKKDPGVVYAAVRRGLARSEDGGATWTMTEGFGELDVLNVAVDPGDCDRVVTVVYTQGVIRSNDGGATIGEPINAGLDLEAERTAPTTFEADESGTVFAATHGGVFTTTFDTPRWERAEVLGNLAFGRIRTTPAAPARVWMSTWGGGVWRRDGPDDPWEHVPTAALPADFIIGTYPDPYDADRLFVDATTGFRVSEDDTQQFRKLNLAGNVTEMLFLDEGRRLLALTQVLGAQESRDGGQSWEARNVGLTAWPTPAGTFIDIKSGLTDPDHNGTILIGTNGRGLFESVDGAASWAPIASALDGATVHQLLRDPTDADHLFARTETDGMFESVDRGATWKSVNLGLPALGTGEAAMSPTTGALFVTTGNRGVFLWDADDSYWRSLSRPCLPVDGFGRLSVFADDEGEWLMGAGVGNTILTHPVPTD